MLNLKEGRAGIHPAPIVFASGISCGVLDGGGDSPPRPLAKMDDLGALLVCSHDLDSETDCGIGPGKIVDRLSDGRVSFKPHLAHLSFVGTDLMESPGKIQLQQFACRLLRTVKRVPALEPETNHFLRPRLL